MNLNKCLIYFSLCTLGACNNFAQVTGKTFQTDEKINLNFNEILNCDSLVVVKDSFDYYFNNADDLINTKDGLTLTCGLRSSTSQYKREYFYIESDSTLLLLKKTNLSDSSYTVTYLKNLPIETIEGETRGCWNEYFLKIAFDKDGKIKQIITLNSDDVIKPKRITFE